MIINKQRIASNFAIELRITTTADAHGKASDRDSTVHEIINAHLDALKIKLDEYLSSIPSKVV